MPKAKLFHNPRCSKSRQALAFMQEQSDIELEVIEYLKEPLERTQVLSIYSALGIDNAHQMIRAKEPEYKTANLSKEASNDAILDAIVAFPKLLERPILLINSKAAIGRPLENFESILQ